MNLVEHLKQIRLSLFHSVEPKEDVLDAVFIADLTTNRFENYLLPYDGIYNKTDKISISNQILDKIESKKFFNNLPSKIDAVDCTIYFFSDPQNLVDYCNTYFFSQNICMYETYNFSGKTIFKGTRPISKSLPYNPDSELIKQLYENLGKVLPTAQPNLESIKKDRLKLDYNLIKELIARENITKLYHFTDKSNLSSILDNKGLYSWASCDRNEIDIHKPGGDSLSRSLDSYYGLQDYVRLSYNKDNPMMHKALKDGRILHPVVLEISPDVMIWNTTLFSDMNATKNGHNVGPTIRDLNKVNFSIAKKSNYLSLAEAQKPYYQAEVLVYSHIPEKFILNINKLT